MKKRLLFWILLVDLILILTFKIGSQSSDHSKSHEIVNFESFLQPDEISCGPTSALMVLSHYGKNPNLDQVKAQTKTHWFDYKGRPIGMTTPEYVSWSLNYFGVKSHVKNLNLDQLKHSVDKNKPVIVLLRSGSKTWHYVVVIGFDEESIVISNPSNASRQKLNNEDFIGAWSFKTDMKGVPTYSPCNACGSTGFWLNSGFGPISICQFCNGTGKKSDYLSSLLSNSDIYPYTAIVPRNSSIE